MVRRVSRIGLFGLYAAKNFGDDLMAVLFGKALQDLGATFSVYGLGPEYGRYGFSIASTVSELVESSDLLIFGGGGILQPRNESSELSTDLDLALRLCRERSVPIYCLSIGGQGLPLSELIPSARRNLVEQAQFITLRLRADLPLLAQAGTMGAHYEDVVWTTPMFFPPHPRAGLNTGPTRIGLQVYPHSKVQRKLLPRIVDVLTKTRRRSEFVFLETFLGTEHPEYKVFRPARMPPNCSYHQFESLEEALLSVQSLDLIITNRLHLGMVAMSYGIPSIALFPTTKTRLCYEELGLGKLCWERKDLWKFGFLLTPRSQQWLLRPFRQLNRDQLRENASMHLRQLREIVAESTERERA